MTSNVSLAGISSTEYLLAMDSVMANALRDAVVLLRDPKIGCPRRAQRLLDSLVEVVAGFALGTFVRSLHAGMVRWFGEPLAHEFLESVARASKVQLLDVEVTYLADAKERPLVNELACRLHLRFCAFSRTLESITRQVETIVQAKAPHKHRVAGLMRWHLRNDADELTRHLRDEIRFGWSMFSAAAAGRDLPAIEGRFDRSRTMWSTWQRAVGAASTRVARADAASAQRDEVQNAGYILLVA